MEICGQIVSGEHGEIFIRQKSGETLEIGEMLAVGENPISIMMVYDLTYGSQLSQGNLELASGMHIEGMGAGLSFMEENLQNYVIAKVKAVAYVKKNVNGKYEASIPKSLPQFFSKVRKVTSADFEFLSDGKNAEHSLYLGCLRSGSSRLKDMEITIDGPDALTHHILITATTGRGKSNLVKAMLWKLLDKEYCGILVLDPHDEYFGNSAAPGMRDHPKAKENVVYYSPSASAPKGSITLRINTKSVKPWHFNGVVNITDAQSQAMHLIYQRYRDDWIRKMFEESAEAASLAFSDERTGGKSGIEAYLESRGVMEGTFAALKRKISVALDIFEEGGKIIEKGVFTTKETGIGAADDILAALESGKKVIIDTSRLSSYAEILVGSIIANKVFEKYAEYKSAGTLDGKPVVSIVLEEAPRVLGASDGEINVFGRIAREGRKFKIGLIGITQLASLIPREVLANMNTKIILGNEMEAERRAIIESAAQDLSTESKMIASLEKGEALVSSIFTKFAIPIYTPLFNDIVKETKAAESKQPVRKYVGSDD
ncbi:MAG: ATP-binding protein [Candidatus Thermoplasmatota archaeon]|nr:ATP-binding protein [Candidatus Thermoplasmatota archaeon]